jgi:hypothetical protein
VPHKLDWKQLHKGKFTLTYQNILSVF